MRYYLIVGEASGDLHASHLMQALRERDAQAQFRFYGGDLMQRTGGQLVCHYRHLAYMGFIPVLLHLRTILRGLAQCKEAILAWRPDVVILVDYPGFNLKIARFVRQQAICPVFYYISPKIWAWKEHRIKALRRDVDRMLHEFENEIVYPIFPGALEFVDLLRERGLKTVIVTSSDDKKMEFLFNQHPEFPSHFDAIVTAADVTHSKPHPEPYLAGATKAGVDPLRCIVFEDSFQGLQAGRAAGCLVVGLSTTNSAEQVAKFADTVTPSLAALSARIDELLG